jgi:hypothetical protein
MLTPGELKPRLPITLAAALGQLQAPTPQIAVGSKSMHHWLGYPFRNLLHLSSTLLLLLEDWRMAIHTRKAIAVKDIASVPNRYIGICAAWKAEKVETAPYFLSERGAP